MRATKDKVMQTSNPGACTKENEDISHWLGSSRDWV